MLVSAFILCNCHDYKWENAYIKHLLYASKILIQFLCVNLGERRGGGSLVHVCVWEYIAFPIEQIDGC